MTTDLIADIISKLIIEEDITLSSADRRWQYNQQYRLCSTAKDKIKELNPIRTILEEGIVKDQTLLLFPQKKIFFHETYLGPNIVLENNNSTAVKSGSDDLQLVFADRAFKSGRHYIEFIFETEPAEKSILIGLSLSRNDFNLSLGDPRSFWGFIPSEGLKISYNDKGTVEKKEYGVQCRINDSVGILLEFTGKGLNVTYFVNKINIGAAFQNLTIQTYYPCIALGFDSSSVRILNDVPYPDL